MTDVLPTETTASDDLLHQLTVATDASIGVIAIRCAETEVYRVVDDIYSLATSQEMPLRIHTAETGWCEFQRVDPSDTRAEPFDPLKPASSDPAGTADIGKAFLKLYGAPESGFPEEGFFVMLDLYFSFEEMKTQTRIRKQAQLALNNGQRLFLVVPHSATIPDSIAPLMHVIEFGYPARAELRDSFIDVMDALDEDDRPELSKEQIDSIVSLGQGMTTNAFETSIAVAITEYTATHEDLDGFSIEHILLSIRDYKTQMLRKTNVLELQPAIAEDQIGGLDLFKAWMHQRALTYTDIAKDNNVTPSRGALVVGPPGCKDGETVIHYRRGKRNSARQILLKDFVAKFNGDPVAKSRPWDISKPTYVQSWDSETGAIFYNEVIGAYETGTKEVLDFKAENGAVIGITPDDSILMADGTFKSAKHINSGDEILVRGSMKPISQGGRSVNRPRVIVEGLKHYDSGWSHEVQTDNGLWQYKRQHRARLVIEARMNNVTYFDYVNALKHDYNHPYTKTLSTAYEVHHLDEDALNDDISNLEVLTKSKHLEQHRQQSIANLNVEYTKPMRVYKMKKLRKVKTYDLQLAAPCANFVCENTFITHNTGKSLVAKAAGSVLNLPVIRFDVGRVFGQFIGQSETAMRGVLTMIDAMAPCVLMLDEIDKGFSGMGGGGGESNGGTTQRVFGTFLTWMQERDQANRPVFLIMTANRVSGLPPELLRRGRVDEIWSVNVPNDEEREAIISIHLAKRGQELSAGDLKAAVRITADLVGAEIEALVEDALVMSLNSEEVGVTFEWIEQAREFLKEMSKTRAAEFAEMQSWAATNARAASTDKAKAVQNKATSAKGRSSIKRGSGRVRAAVTRKPKGD